MSLNHSIQANAQNNSIQEQSSNIKTIFMRKEDWEKWDTSLRSGEYKQGRLKLQTDDGRYCCLGVLQHCLTGEVEREFSTGACGVPSLEWLNANGIKFMNRTGLDAVSNPWLGSLGMKATNANDTNMKFVRIADAIKESVQFTDSTSST